jgi:hypothetical protein
MSVMNQNRNNVNTYLWVNQHKHLYNNIIYYIISNVITLNY